jgi:hypothetical protein
LTNGWAGYPAVFEGGAMKRRDFIMFFGSAALWPWFWLSGARAQNPAATDQPAGAAAGGVGQVGTVQGSATVTRANAGSIPLQVGDPIFKNDTLATGPNATLGITFDDETTFSLSPNTRIVVNEFVYQEGGAGNSALFNVAVGTAAFVASQVAKTGDMKIATPVATLGIRGTTGVVDVPQAGTAGEEPRIKLYADTDGHVGRIEVFNAQGGALGTLTQGASAFAFRAGPGGRFQAVAFQIPPAEAARDRGVLQRLFVTHNIGRRMTGQRRRERRFNREFRRQERRGGRTQQPFNHNPRGNPRGNPNGRGRRQ